VGPRPVWTGGKLGFDSQTVQSIVSAYAKNFLFFSTLLIRILGIILYYFDLQYCIRHDALFTPTRKSIFLLTGIISIFLGPDEHLQVSELPVACGH
jgi:hypothetical protein